MSARKRRPPAFAPALLALLLLACSPGREPAAVPAPTAPPPDTSPGPPLPASEILGLLQASRLAAAEDMVEIALALPPNSRDFEVSWVLSRGSPAQAGRLIEGLRPAEGLRLRDPLLDCARSPDPRARDPALIALASAGVEDVQPLVSRALRTGARDDSLAVVATAAGRLGPLRPVDALKAALARARTPPALRAIVEALGPALDADVLRILASRGPAGGSALELALGLLRAPKSGPGSAGEDPGPAPELVPAALAALGARATAIAGEDEARERTVTGWLGRRLWGRGPEAAASAAALGAIGSRVAAIELGTALAGAEGRLAAAVSAALSRALRIAPARLPEDPRDLRRAWFPILSTLVPESNARGLDRL